MSGNPHSSELEPHTVTLEESEIDSIKKGGDNEIEKSMEVEDDCSDASGGAVDAMSPLPPRTATLKEKARFFWEQCYGPATVRSTTDKSLSGLLSPPAKSW